MVMPTRYKTASPLLVNYDFQEVIEGTGNLVFYPGNGLDASATEKDILSSSIFNSDEIEHQQATGDTTSFTKLSELNYDLSDIKISQTTKGFATVSLSWAIYGHASATITGYMVVKLIRVRDSAETVMGTGKTGELAKAAAAWELKTSTLILDLTETRLQVGDTLRLSVENWRKTSGGGLTGKGAWGHDPANRNGTIFTDSTVNPTQIKLTVPFNTEQ